MNLVKSVTKTCVAAVILAGFFAVTGCNKKVDAKEAEEIQNFQILEKDFEPGEYIEIELTDSSDAVFSKAAKTSTLTSKRFLVLFGYGFQTPETRNPILEALKDRYGVDEEGGLIYPIFYADSFKRGVKGYISEFTAFLEDKEKDYAGVIVLGAPENTHKAFANHQDFWNGKVPYPVIALFSQDDVLGIESTSDIVIDNGKTKTDEMGDNEETITEEEVIELLESIIDYVMAAGSNFDRDKVLQQHVQNLLGGRNFHRYVDPETGLQSINHFVLY